MDEAVEIMRDGDWNTKMAKDCVNVIGTLVSSLEKVLDKTFDRVLKTTPSFRLHEIVLEMLVLVDTSCPQRAAKVCYGVCERGPQASRAFCRVQRENRLQGGHVPLHFQDI